MLIKTDSFISIVRGTAFAHRPFQRLAQAAQMTDYSKLRDPNSQFEQSMKELVPEDSSDYKSNLSTFVENLKVSMLPA